MVPSWRNTENNKHKERRLSKQTTSIHKIPHSDSQAFDEEANADAESGSSEKSDLVIDQRRGRNNLALSNRINVLLPCTKITSAVSKAKII
jgi:hypothetical protein